MLSGFFGGSKDDDTSSDKDDGGIFSIVSEFAKAAKDKVGWGGLLAAIPGLFFGKKIGNFFVGKDKTDGTRSLWAGLKTLIVGAIVAVGVAFGIKALLGNDDEPAKPDTHATAPDMSSDFSEAAAYISKQTGLDPTMVEEITSSFESVVGKVKGVASVATDEISDFAQKFADKHDGKITVESVKQVCQSYLDFEPS